MKASAGVRKWIIGYSMSRDDLLPSILSMQLWAIFNDGHGRGAEPVGPDPRYIPTDA